MASRPTVVVYYRTKQELEAARNDPPVALGSDHRFLKVQLRSVDDLKHYKKGAKKARRKNIPRKAAAAKQQLGFASQDLETR